LPGAQTINGFIRKRCFTIPDKRGGQKASDVPSIIPDDEAVCAVMYARYVYKLRSGKAIPVTELLAQEGYVVSDKMLRLNDENWQLVKELQAMWNKERIFQSLRKFSRLQNLTIPNLHHVTLPKLDDSAFAFL